MAEYLKKAGTEDTDFLSLAEDKDFQADLVRFFSGGRYKYSKEQMKEKGFDGLAKEFVTHMRWQDWNEIEAVRDYNYVQNKDLPEAGKQAFGRLMQAWDSSDSAGSGFFDSAGDIAGAIAASPSTYVGLGSFGLGKLASKGAQKVGNMALRRALSTALKKPSIGTSAAIGAVEGAAVGGGQSIAQGETRERVIEDYEYTVKDGLLDAAISGAVGGGLGAAGGWIGNKRANEVEDFLKKRGETLAEESKKATKEALDTLDKADAETKQKAMEILGDLDDVLGARAGVEGAKIKDPLDPERVVKGKALLSRIGNPDANDVFESGLSVDTMRKVAAASIDVMDKIKEKSGGLRKGERITEVVARALREGDVEGFVDDLTNIRSKYGLNKDEFSLIYLAEVSRAGQTLGFASSISRAAGKTDADVLLAKGVSSLGEEDMKRIASEAIKNSAKTGTERGLNFLRDVDAMRIAFMTSQPATTMRNVRNVAIMLGTDVMDQANKALYKGLLKGDTKAIKDVLPNMAATLRGYTTSKAEAAIVRELMLEEMPEQAKRLYNHAMRIDVALEGNSRLAKAGRVVNLANTASDSIFKEGMFYGSLDRQLREKADISLNEWLKTNVSLEKLPSGVSIDEAVEEANRLTMQRDFRGDTSAVAQATKALSDFNRKAPFIVSEAMGIPFPRYMGNHINTIAEYTPFVGEALYKMGAISGAADDATRYARQLTGVYAMVGGYVLADMRGGEVDYGSIKKEMGAVEDMKPYVGSYLFHLWLGDRSWRINNGMPITEGQDLARELSDVFGGIPDFSVDFTLPIEAIKSAANGETTEKFEKEIGSVLSTFTMPAAVARDMVGQFSYDAAGSPFTRDLNLNETVGTGSGVLVNQATRMLPDIESIQYTQSFNGQTAIPTYKISNPVAIGKVNPLTKQITGSTEEPPLTALEMEMNKANIKDWQIYKTYDVSPNIDLVVRHNLAKKLYKDFNDFRKNDFASQRYGTKKYDEIEDPKERAGLLKEWLGMKIRREKESVEQQFNAMLSSDKAGSRGFVRNNYTIKRKEIGDELLDRVAGGLGYSTAEDYIADSENVTEEINRRLEIMDKVSRILPNKPY